MKGYSRARAFRTYGSLIAPAVGAGPPLGGTPFTPQGGEPLGGATPPAFGARRPPEALPLRGAEAPRAPMGTSPIGGAAGGGRGATPPRRNPSGSGPPLRGGPSAPPPRGPSSSAGRRRIRPPRRGSRRGGYAPRPPSPIGGPKPPVGGPEPSGLLRGAPPTMSTLPKTRGTLIGNPRQKELLAQW